GTMPTASLVALVSSGPYSATVATGYPRSPLLALLCSRLRARSSMRLLSLVWGRLSKGRISRARQQQPVASSEYPLPPCVTPNLGKRPPLRPGAGYHDLPPGDGLGRQGGEPAPPNVPRRRVAATAVSGVLRAAKACRNHRDPCGPPEDALALILGV